MLHSTPPLPVHTAPDLVPPGVSPPKAPTGAQRVYPVGFTVLYCLCSLSTYYVPGSKEPGASLSLATSPSAGQPQGEQL